MKFPHISFLLSQGEVCCHSASLTKGLFVRGGAAGVSQPSSPMFAPAHSQSRTSQGSSRTIFPYPSTHQDRSPPKSPCRLNFSGIFRSSSNSSSNSSIKLFSRTRKGNTNKCISKSRLVSCICWKTSRQEVISIIVVLDFEFDRIINDWIMCRHTVIIWNKYHSKHR